MTPVYLDFDPYGQATSNKQFDEEHPLVPNRPVRAIVLDYGAFFSSSLVVKNKATGLPLVRGTQYRVTDIYKKPSMKYGSEMAGSITIEDATIGDVLVTYQPVGGSYSFSNKALYANIGEIELDDKPVDFKDIIAKPERYTPAPHLHDAGDLFGLEYIVRGLEEVKDAILLGDQASHDEIYRDIEYFRGLTQDKIDDLRQRINDHLSDYGNPHQTTAFQAGTYTKQEVQNLLSQTSAALNTLATALETRMTAHFTNYTNAHGTTPAMLGGLTKAEFDAMLAQFTLDLAAGANGYWDIVYSGNGATTYDYVTDPFTGESYIQFSSPYGYKDGIPIGMYITNTTAFAQFYSVSVNAFSNGALMNYIWVDDLLITDSGFGQYGDPKNQQAVAYVPAGSTIYVANAGGTDIGTSFTDNMYIGRWTRN